MDNIFERNIKELTELRDKITAACGHPSNSERARANFLLAEIDIQENDFFFNHEGPDKTPVDSRYSGGFKPDSAYARESGKPYELRTARDKKDFRSLYGSDGNEYRWTDKESTFFEALFGGRHHPNLLKRSLNESVPSDGGFLVPTEHVEVIHNVALENELIMPMATVQPMKSNSINIPAVEIGNHSSNLFGGFVASYKAESASLTEANPKARLMSLNCNKLTGFLKFSNELMSDIPNGEAQILDICGKGLAWYRDKSWLTGSGAGEPLGVFNSNCLLSQSPESGQLAGSIVYSNLTGMMAKLHAASFKNSVWIAHQSTIPQLLELSIAVGTGGNHIPVLKESDGKFTILTRPVIFTEKTEPLGSKGDILFADFSQYIIGMRSELRIELSQHVYFTTDEGACRLIERHDGQPLWDAPLKLKDGSTEVSPFVCLAERV